MNAGAMTLVVIALAFLALGAAIVFALIPMLDQVNDAVSALAR